MLKLCREQAGPKAKTPEEEDMHGAMVALFLVANNHTLAQLDETS